MRSNLAIDQFEAPPSIGDLLTQVRSKLGQQIAMFAGRSLRVHVQLEEFAGKQRLPLRIERGDVALGMLNLPRDAQKLCGRAFARNRSV